MAERRSMLDCNVRYAAGLMRALLGAMIFALPMLMTMEMWQLGATMSPFRLAVLLVLTFPALVGLSFYAGFEATFSVTDNVLDAFAAIAVAAAASCAVLWLFGEIGPATPFQETVGKLAVMSFAASIGALLADKQFNDQPDEPDDRRDEGYQRGLVSRLFVMGVGAIFLALNVAPTDEIAAIASNISPWQAAILCVASFAALHVILRVADPEAKRMFGGDLVRRSLAGYGVCLALCGFILWCFGRFDGMAFDECVECIIVLAFPASLGAGAAHLILGGGEDGG
ncbi:MAG: TIGR02587 family membrane protein [Alphaproteobacteria bacterium]|nr:TIGR02587 family membrane protein [Alphaproteobacteria bacterium]